MEGTVAYWTSKLTATPILIVAASAAGRRFGPRTGGLIAGLPLTSAPISVFLFVEQGPDFAARAAVGSLGGVAAVGVFCLAYASSAVRHTWRGASSAGVLGFLVIAAFIGGVQPGLLGSTAAAVTALVVALHWFPRPAVSSPARIKPRWDLPARALVATGVVVAITSAAERLGPYISGLLSPYPVFANVLSAFTHAMDGPAAGVRLLRGVVLSSFGFAGFFVVVGATLPRWGPVITYSGAAALSVGLSWLCAHIDRTNTEGGTYVDREPGDCPTTLRGRSGTGPSRCTRGL